MPGLPTQDGSATKVRIAPDVLWRAWDDEIVCYSNTTGDTHHFADLAAWLFRLLSTEAANEPEIEATALQRIELPTTVDGPAAIRRTLDMFQRLSLLEAA